MAIPDPSTAETLTNSKRKLQEGEGEGTSQPKKPKHSLVWANLDLILSLQNKELDLQRKIELASNSVASDANRRSDQLREPVSISRLASFLSEWIQPMLISSTHNKKSSGLSDACLDFRCWAILRFCIDNSSVGVSSNLLRAVARVSQHATSVPNAEESILLFEGVLDCLTLIISSNARAFYNAGVELWVSSSVDIVHLVRGVLSIGAQSSPAAGVLLKFSILMLEQFGSFLRFHPNPKNVFRVFVDRMLEPSLELLVLLQLKVAAGECGQVGDLLRIVEEVLPNGLFHPAHISGFLMLKNSSANQESRESRGIKESYHRHFFQKLEKIITEKKAMALGGFGYLFRMFATSVKARKRDSLSFKKNDRTSAKSSEVSDEAQETSKPLFEAFMQFMEPLLLECRRCAEKEFLKFGEVCELRLVEAHCMLKSVNETLLSFIREKIYLRVEDTSEGAHFDFLKGMFETIILISEKMYILWVSVLPMDDERVKKMLPLIAREVVVALGYFLEIEYKVLGDDLIKLWLVMLSYLAACMSSEEEKPCSLLTSAILKLGSKVINIYSELRQAANPIFALCKAMRIFVVAGDSAAEGFSTFISSQLLPPQICLKSFATLLSSQEFRLSISNAINSIPEGQASECVQRLKVDIIDSLDWLRVSPLKSDEMFLGETIIPDTGVSHFDIRAELLGKLLSEIYTIVLDSITVTATNSVIIGNSVQNKMQIIGPRFGYLVGNQSDEISEFPIFESYKSGSGISWITVFFFRLYVSCRSLYRQSISLMPPGSSKKAAVEMGNLFVVCTSMNWGEKSESMDEGYFSWAVKPSKNLPDVISSLPKDFLLRGSPGYTPLVYIIRVMALQRLNDLNRLIKAFEFLHERDTRLVQTQSHDTTEISKLNKKRKKLTRILRKEARKLTKFMVGNLVLLDTDGQKYAWDLSVCSLNENSLPIAVWWLLCQNTDVWCIHANKNNLEEFLSHLFHYLLQCGSTSTDKTKQSTNTPVCEKVTMHHISLRFLNDTALFEEKGLYKHFADSFCRILEKSLHPLMLRACTSEIDLSTLPDWSKLLNMFENAQTTDKDDRDDSDDHSLLSESCLFRSRMRDAKDKGKSLPPSCVEFRTCEDLLNILCMVLGVFVDNKSFSLYATYVFNLERILVSYLVNYHMYSCMYNPYELFSLFKTCRRVIKYLVVGSAERNSGAKSFSFFSNMLSSSSSVSWLLISVSEIVGFLHTFYKGTDPIQVDELTFSLIDHTSCLFSMISKSTMPLLIIEDNNPNDWKSDCSESFDAGKYVELVTEVLEEHTRNLTYALKSSTTVLNWNKVSSVISCFQGFLWGLVPGLEQFHEDRSTKNSDLLRYSFISKLNNCIAVFEDFIHLCLDLFLLYDSQEFEVLCPTHNLPNLDMDVLIDGANRSTPGYDDEGNDCSGCDHTKLLKKWRSSSGHANNVIDILNAFQTVDLSKLQNLKGPLLQSLLKGTNPQIAFMLRELFMASAAFLKLKSVLPSRRGLGEQIDRSRSASSSMGILIGISHIVLVGMANMFERPDPLSFIWLDGILKYLEVVGISIKSSDLNFSKDVYALIVDTHVRAIGKCISLQGKAATLSSHEMGSSTKLLSSQNPIEQRRYDINTFKSRLRKSFKQLINRPYKLHMKTVMHALERSLVGVLENCNMVGINTGDVYGGSVSSVVAGGIDCLDLVLESIAGQKHAKQKDDLGESIPSLIGAIFNIVLHLQNPTIFLVKNLYHDTSDIKPNAGSTVLMCVEVLTVVVGTHSLEMHPCHVSQCLNIPMPLFRKFHQLGNPSLFSCNMEAKPVVKLQQNNVDRQFSVDLYASCCRLLCTTLKNQKGKVAQCIALLEDSVRVLLSCLETVDTDLLSGQCYFSWDIQEAIKCASFLRRIYEEIRQQKDVLGKYSYYFLSTYISIYSGCGPLRTGIKRDIDESLRPGVYSLVDICTPDDLQKLHTMFGEGPCRSTLATLLNDYRVNFQFEGKV